MKLIITGTRTIHDKNMFENAIVASGFAKEKIDEVVSSGSVGVEALGIQWAKAHGIPIKIISKDLNRLGNEAIAEPALNKFIVEYVGGTGALLALWDGVSYGTKHMATIAKAAGLQVKVYKPKRRK